jgi:hypothetical protein
MRNVEEVYKIPGYLRQRQTYIIIFVRRNKLLTSIFPHCSYSILNLFIETNGSRKMFVFLVSMTRHCEHPGGTLKPVLPTLIFEKALSFMI